MKRRTERSFGGGCEREAGRAVGKMLRLREMITCFGCESRRRRRARCFEDTRCVHFRTTTESRSSDSTCVSYSHAAVYKIIRTPAQRIHCMMCDDYDKTFSVQGIPPQKKQLDTFLYAVQLRQILTNYPTFFADRIRGTFVIILSLKILLTANMCRYTTL